MLYIIVFLQMKLEKRAKWLLFLESFYAIQRHLILKIQIRFKVLLMLASKRSKTIPRN